MIRPDTKTAAPRMPSDDGTEDLDGLVELDDLEDLDDLDELDSFDDLEGLEDPQSRAGEREKQTATTGSPRHVATTPRRHEEGADSAPEASAGSGKARGKAAPQPPQETAQSPAKRKRGRPPVYPPHLDPENSDTINALAEAAVGLRSRMDLTLDLDSSEALLTRFMRRKDVQREVRSRVRELRQSGRAARRLANISLSANVLPAMDGIVGDAEAGPSAKIGAAGVIAKVAGAGGQEQREEQPRFSITLNLGGKPLTVEAPVSHERAFEHGE